MFYDQKIWVGTDGDGNAAYLLPHMANRHGLIAGATGTGKTVSLKVIAEGFSDMGVPVFLSDIKGDLSGMVKEGAVNANIEKRVKMTGMPGFEPKKYPACFWDVYGEQGIPVRTTVMEMGPMLLSRMLGLNETQSGVLNIVFRVANDGKLPQKLDMYGQVVNEPQLQNIADLKQAIAYVGSHADEYTVEYGNVSRASIGAIQRAVALLEDQGGDKFFGTPSLKISDWIKTDENGQGLIHILACDKLFLNPLMYSTFLLWLLTELYELLPERGDCDKPVMVFFFDEAHLLFNDCPKQLMDKIEQVVRLIRSKGVGVYFITQNPTDVPMTVLGQLGNRVQHALRAFTPLDQKAVKVAAQTFRTNPKFDTEEAITLLKTGEALVSFLDENGAPGIVQRATILPPQSYMGAITVEERNEVINQSEFKGVYQPMTEQNNMEQVPVAQQPMMQQPQQGFMVLDPTTGQYVQQPMMQQPMMQQGMVQQPMMQQPMMQQPMMQAAPAQAAVQTMLVMDPTTGQYVQRQMQFNPATGQYMPVMTEEEKKAAALAAKEAEKAAKEAAKAEKEALAEARRLRADELREERAERARVNDSVLGRIKNTAISSATRTATNKLVNGLLNSILGSGKKK